MAFDIRLLVWLTVGFILSVVAGTLSHELGHYAVAKYLGYAAEITYGYTFWEPLDGSSSVNPLHSFYITLGGPVQTMSFGTVGIILLFATGKNFGVGRSSKFMHWFLIFLSLFWLRQAAIFVGRTLEYFIVGRFSHLGDEAKIADHLQMASWSICLLTGSIGFVVLATVINRFVPQETKVTFIVAGLTGGPLGYVLWNSLLGER